MAYVHLHVYSEYSLLRSTCRVEALAARARREGQSALALTDRNAMYGVIPFYNACMKEGIRPIIGMELSVGEKAATGQRQIEEAPVLVLLAENNEGYRNLVKLASIVRSRSERVGLDDLRRFAAGLIVLSGGPAGVLDRLFEKGQDEAAQQTAEELAAAFPDNFYIEYQRPNGIQGSAVERKKRRLSKRLGLPSVATHHVRYLDRADARACACLRCIDEGSELTDLEDRPADGDFVSTKTMRQRFSDLPGALEASEVIAAKCRVTFSFGRMRFPSFPVAEGKTSGEMLRETCECSLRKKYPDDSGEARRRMEKELNIIGKMGFDDYFLIVADLVGHARSAGYLPGPGRGSAAGSLVAYLLDITEVDPLKYRLLFERFLNPERITMPDIDMDYPDVDRDKMIAYASRKYGRDHVAQIVTFGTLAARAAIRDTGRVTGTDPRLVDRVARLIPQVPKMTLDRALAESEKLRRLLDASPEGAALFNLAKQIEGLPRHSSIHAAGVVFSDRPLTDLIPVQHGHNEIPVTQYPMEVLEQLGLLKIDFLGLRNLTFMREVIRRVVRAGTELTAESIPANDPQTLRLLGEGNTTGIFQLESDGMRQVLRKLRPTDFEDVVAVIALYRPGPVRFIDRFIRRRHGEESVSYPHPDLKPILAPTCGVLVYQEQIMQIAVRMAGYSLGQADILRRAVAKKKRGLLESQKKSFIDGSIRRGYTQETAERIFDLIVRFANYGFNRSHAVAYGIVSYRLAYLKAHYPQIFMACHLSSVAGNAGKLTAAVQEIRRMGIPIVGPSVNRSRKTFESEGKAIRFGFIAIKNLGEGAIDEIVKERERSGMYRGLFDFCRRVSARRVNRKAVESMIFAGAMDEFGIDRAVLLASLDRAMRSGEAEQKTKPDGQGTLLPPDEPADSYTDVPPLSASERLHYERDALGIYLSAHPLQRVRNRLPASFATLGRLPSGHAPFVLAACIEDTKPLRTKQGKKMAFFTLNDEFGTSDAVCFPPHYEQLQDILQDNRMVVVRATVSEGRGGSQLSVDRAEPLAEYLRKLRAVLFIRIDRFHNRSSIFRQLKRTIGEFPGRHRVVLHYEVSGKTVLLDTDYTVGISGELLECIRRLLGEKNVVVGSRKETSI